MDNWALVRGFQMLGDMDRKRFEEKVMSNRDQRSAESRGLAEGGTKGKIEAQRYLCVQECSSEEAC